VVACGCVNPTNFGAFGYVNRRGEKRVREREGIFLREKNGLINGSPLKQEFTFKLREKEREFVL